MLGYRFRFFNLTISEVDLLYGCMYIQNELLFYGNYFVNVKILSVIFYKLNLNVFCRQGYQVWQKKTDLIDLQTAHESVKIPCRVMW